MKRYRAIFFDLFHTLVDVGTIPDHIGRFTADVLGVDRRRWNDACFSDHHDICRHTDHLETLRALAWSIDPTIPDALIQEAVVDRQRRFDYTLENVSATVTDVIAALRREGWRIGLISNASTAEVAAWPRSPLAPLFDSAVFSCDCGLRKPDPEIFHHALRQLDVRAEEALFVGDGGSDEHEGARSAGLTRILTTEFVADIEEERLRRRRAAVEHEITAITALPQLLGSFSRA